MSPQPFRLLSQAVPYWLSSHQDGVYGNPPPFEEVVVIQLLTSQYNFCHLQVKQSLWCCWILLPQPKLMYLGCDLFSVQKLWNSSISTDQARCINEWSGLGNSGNGQDKGKLESSELAKRHLGSIKKQIVCWSNTPQAWIRSAEYWVVNSALVAWQKVSQGAKLWNKYKIWGSFKAILFRYTGIKSISHSYHGRIPKRGCDFSSYYF